MNKPFKALIERRLVLKDGDTKSTINIKIVIGTPRWVKKGMEAACPVAVEGWLGRVEDMRGIDPMNALEMALFFVNSLPKKLPAAKRIAWPNGDPYEGTQVDAKTVVPDHILRGLLKIQRRITSSK